MKFILKPRCSIHMSKAIEKFYDYMDQNYGTDVVVDRTIREIADEIGYGFSTIYNYFEKLKWHEVLEIIERPSTGPKKGRKRGPYKKNKKQCPINNTAQMGCAPDGDEIVDAKQEFLHSIADLLGLAGNNKDEAAMLNDEISNALELYGEKIIISLGQAYENMQSRALDAENKLKRLIKAFRAGLSEAGQL